ncbi:MAG TPA: helix-turn-helix domain-containing protein [Candidatus Thermoplasmatota archaeon]|nr:helix-turn-helix domain-containing protein [Candidatus Thermoplasmatota archaeon]
MKPMQEMVGRMMEAGLTQYEAQAYLVLKDLGPSRVTQIARASGVPRNKLYGALSELERMGLAEAVVQEPLTYATRPISEFLRERIQTLESLMVEIGAREAAQAPLADSAGSLS